VFCGRELSFCCGVRSLAALISIVTSPNFANWFFVKFWFFCHFRAILLNELLCACMAGATNLFFLAHYTRGLDLKMVVTERDKAQ